MKDIDEVYRSMPPEQIPWNHPDPPPELVEMVTNGKIAPCRAVDLGCGAGNSSIWLAGQGFETTGIELSPAAVELARKSARDRGVECEFIAADLTGPIDIKGQFDFAFEWEVLHHVFPQDRDAYLDNVKKMLEPRALYLAACFHVSDDFAGKDKYRETRIGTLLYFSDEDELEKLYRPRFEILEMEVKEIRGKFKPHKAVCALMKNSTPQV